jgi:hypothetical protein
MCGKYIQELPFSATLSILQPSVQTFSPTTQINNQPTNHQINTIKHKIKNFNRMEVGDERL